MSEALPCIYPHGQVLNNAKKSGSMAGAGRGFDGGGPYPLSPGPYRIPKSFPSLPRVRW